MLRHILMATSLGLVAEAFTIPSTVSLPDFKFGTEGHDILASSSDDFVEQFRNLHIDIGKVTVPAHAVEQQSVPLRVALPCEGCAKAMPDFPKIEKSGDKTFLELRLNIAPGRNTLDINSRAIFPVRGRPRTISALAVTNGSGSPHEGRLEYIAGAYITDSADENQPKLINLYIQFTGFDGVPINVEAVSIRLVRDNMGNYLLRQVIVPSSEASVEPILAHDAGSYQTALYQQAEADCSTLTGWASKLCRLRVNFNGKMNALQLKRPNFFKHHDHPRPCSGRPNRLGNSEGIGHLPIRGGPAKFAGKFHREDFRSRHQMKQLTHIVATSLYFVFWDILVPAVIGVVACVSASLLGMIVGTLIAAIWLKVVRGGKRGNASCHHHANKSITSEDEDGTANSGEKKALMDQAPAYEETEPLPKYVEKE